MESVSGGNAWIDSYLEALLSTGLSSEYSRAPASESSGGKGAAGAGGGGASSSSSNNNKPGGRRVADADASVYAKYYVNQILQLGEEGIKGAWARATSTRGGTERDARLEHLSWRVWHLKRKKEAAARARAAAAARAAALGAAGGGAAPSPSLSASASARHFADTDLDDDDLLSPAAMGQATPLGGGGITGVAAAGGGGGALSSGRPTPRSSADVRSSSSTTATAATATAAAGAAEPRGRDTVAAAAAALADLRLPDRSLPRVRIAASPAGGAGEEGMSSEAWLQGGYSGSPTGADAAGAPAAAAPPARSVRLQSPSPARQQQQPKDPFANRVDGLYIVLASTHGLVRGERMELGRDPDTGGQVKYVVELAKALSRHPAVHRVDLLTRLVADPRVDPEYSEPVEVLVPPRTPHATSASAAASAAAAAAAASSSSPGKKTSFDAAATANTPTATGGPDAAAANAAALGGAYIVRLRAGPPSRYLRKERLWPHVREFADRGIAHVRATLAALSDAGAPCELYCVHGHYADAGEAAALMAATLGVDMVITGHSLGRNKLEHLLASGTMTRAEVEASYRISRRIEAEERALESAVMVLTSTRQEVDDQWGLYHAYNQKLASVLAARPRPGRSMPAMTVIPPGLDFSALRGVDLPKGPAGGGGAGGGGGGAAGGASAGAGGGAGGGAAAAEGATGDGAAKAYGVEALLSPRAGETSSSGIDADKGAGAAASGAATPRGGGLLSPRASEDNNNNVAGGDDDGPSAPPAPHQQQQQQEDPPIWGDIFSFLKNPRKPAILAMSRPDAKKNLTTLVEAFAANGTLRQLANLVLVMGNRDTLEALAPGSRAVVEAVFRLVDNHGLWGSVAFPKHHAQSDVSDIYRLPHATRGVFVNVALQEPFGLTVIEAAAHGVPCVATKHGGPVDILATLHHGLLVEPTDAKAVGDALLKILTTPALWDSMARSGKENVSAYSWPAHCDRYLRALEGVKGRARAAAASRARLSGTWDLESLRARDRRQRSRQRGVAVGAGASQELLDRVAAAGGEGSDGELHQQQGAAALRRRRGAGGGGFGGGGADGEGGGASGGEEGRLDDGDDGDARPSIALSPRGSAGELLGPATSAGFAGFGGGGAGVAALPLSPQRAPSPPPDLGGVGGGTAALTPARLLLPPVAAAASPSSGGGAAVEQQQRLRSAPALHKSSSFVAAASADDCLLASASAADDVGDALAAAAAASAALGGAGIGGAGERAAAAGNSRRNSASGGGGALSFPGPMGYRRTRFVVVPLDGEHGAEAAAAAIVAFAAAIEAGEQARAAFLDDAGADDDGEQLRLPPPPPPLPGLGVASTLGFDHSARLLAEHGAPLDALDWIVCHAGADIWHAHSSNGDGLGQAMDADDGAAAATASTPTNNTCPPGASRRWAADDAWEEHIGAGWDRASVARLVVKVLRPSPLASLGDHGLLGALAGAGAGGGGGGGAAEGGGSGGGGGNGDDNKNGAHAAAAAAGAAAAELDDASLAALLRTLDGLSPAGRTHPHHVLLDLDRETSRAVAAAARAAAAAAASGGSGSAASIPARATTEEVALSVVDRLRRRMRANGYRAHMTLEAVPVPKATSLVKEEEGGAADAAAAAAGNNNGKKKPSTVSARLHITPLRASRALALRFLACRFGLTMDDFTVVGLPPAVRLVPESAAVASKRRKAAAEEGGGGGGGGSESDGGDGLEDLDPCYDVTPRTSDLVELASGACAVRILEPEKKKKKDKDADADDDDDDGEIFAAAAASPLLSRLEFRVDPDDFGRRVRLLRRCSSSSSSSASSSPLALAAAEVVSVPPPAPTPLAGPSPRASADFEFRLRPAGSSGAGGGGTTTTTTAATALGSASATASGSSAAATAASSSSLKQKAAAAAAAAVKRATRLLSTLEETRDGNVWKH